MKLVSVAEFDVVRRELEWPWIAFDASGRAFACAASDGTIALRLWDGERVVDGATFALPSDLELPRDPRPADVAAPPPKGALAFAVDAVAGRLAVVGGTSAGSVVVTCDADGEQARTGIEALAGPGATARAVLFDRTGTRLWISAETATETVLLLVDAASHARIGLLRSEAFPPPAMHELHRHPTDDAVLLLAACGQDGTFARIARAAEGGIAAVSTALDEGGVAAGIVGFYGGHLIMTESDAVRTHAWPSLTAIDVIDFEGDFVASYSGAVLGGRVLVDGQDEESGEDRVAAFDPASGRIDLLAPPFPQGMWAGRLGDDALVTVEAKGDPARGRVVRIAG